MSGFELLSKMNEPSGFAPYERLITIRIAVYSNFVAIRFAKKIFKTFSSMINCQSSAPMRSDLIILREPGEFESRQLLIMGKLHEQQLHFDLFSLKKHLKYK